MNLHDAAEWFSFADTDLSSAAFLQSMTPPPFEIICYHCQQAAEKYLKGYIIAKELSYPPQTHNLIILQTMCIDFDSRFTDINRACDVLNRYGVHPRYPNEMEISETDMLRALDYARQVRDCEPLRALRESVNS